MLPIKCKEGTWYSCKVLRNYFADNYFTEFVNLRNYFTELLCKGSTRSTRPLGRMKYEKFIVFWKQILQDA